jgi:hypothetical protein
LRAHPKLDKFGGFFDWVDAKFDVMGVAQDSSDEMHMAPAKLLAFYVDANGEECAVVHSVEWTGGKETALGNTRLIKNCCLEFQSTGFPSMRKIRLDDMHRPVHVTERKRGGKHPVPPQKIPAKARKEHVVSVIKPRTEWAEMFHWWAKDEVEPWVDEELEVV